MNYYSALKIDPDRLSTCTLHTIDAPMDGSAKRKRAGSQTSGQSNTNVSNRPSQYRTFDTMTVSLREGVVKSCVDQYFEHCRKNGGRIKRGFLKDLVQQTNEKTGGHLDIKRDDIKNAIKRINKEKKKFEDQQSWQVSPTDFSNSLSSPAEIFGSSMVVDDTSQLKQSH